MRKTIDTKALKKYIGQQWGYETKVKNDKGILEIEFPDLPGIRTEGYGGNPSLNAIKPILKDYIDRNYDVLAVSIGLEAGPDEEEEDEEEEQEDEENETA